MTVVMKPWHHDSELAFVRDCFYPHHASLSFAGEPDIYKIPSQPDPELDGSVTNQNIESLADPLIVAQIQNYRSALQQVSIWTFKSPRQVPHAVSATAAFIDARLHDELTFGPNSTDVVLDLSSMSHTRPLLGEDPSKDGALFTLSEQALKSIYAMAFLRFVNGFVDRDVSRSSQRTGLSNLVSNLDTFIPDSVTSQVTDSNDVNGEHNLATKNAGESSMYAFAVLIGMPSTFVDLRHRCVHGAVLPELALLRSMTDKALEWLWQRWWKSNATGTPGRWVWEVESEQTKQLRSGYDNDGNEINAMAA